MAEPERIAPRLTDKQLLDALALIKESDSVELKLTVPLAEQRSAITSLGMDPLDAQIRQVFFFDTPHLDLNKAGLVVRARRVQGRGDDSVVKLRPVVPIDLPTHLRASPNLVVEVDAMPGGYVCSATMKRRMESGSVKPVLDKGGSIRPLFSKEQRHFFTEHSPDGIGLDDLSTLGPIFVLKLKFKPSGYDGKMVAELWLYPDDSRILELSAKCKPKKALEVAVETRAFLASRRVDLGGEQQTKTKTALDYFAKRSLAAV